MEKDIIATLDKVASKLNRGKVGRDKPWTRAIKRALCRLGHKYKYAVSASGCKGADYGEWLFDLMWATGKEDDLEDVPLVMESEWSPDYWDLMMDFQKLVIARAGLRLFIFYGADRKKVEETIKKLKKEIKKFKKTQKGDRYLFASFIDGEDKFYYRKYAVN